MNGAPCKGREHLPAVLNSLSEAMKPGLRKERAQMVLLIRLPCGCVGAASNTDAATLAKEWIRGMEGTGRAPH